MKNFLELIASLFGKGALSRVMGTRTNVVRFPNQESQRFITTDLNIEAASDAAVKQAYKYAEELFPSYPRMNDAEKLIFEGNLRRLDNAITDRGLKIKELEETQLPSAQLKNLKERLEKNGEDLKKTIDEKKSQSIVQGAIDDFLKTEKILDDFDRTGYVRATVRQIMREDIQAGKLKLPKEIENEIMQGLGEPIDTWRKVYGEGALEQIDSIADDLSKLRTEVQAAQMARSKFKFEPDVNRPPGSYTPEEEIESNVVPFKKKPDEPEKFAMGGNVESKGLDYLMGLSRPYATGGRVGFAAGTPKKILDLIAKANKELSKKKSMESMNPKTGELTIPKDPIKLAEEPKAGEGKFTKQQILEKIIQKTIETNPTDEYIQTTFPNFIKEIRANPELANNENVWKTFTQDFPENKRLVVYGDDTVDFFTKGEDLPKGMQQTQELSNTYGISMKEARRIKQMEPEDQVMEIKKLQVLKKRTEQAEGGLNYLMGL